MNRRPPEAAPAWLRPVLPALVYLALRWALGRALAFLWAPLSDAATLMLLPAALWACRRDGLPRPRLPLPRALIAALCGVALGLATAALHLGPEGADAKGALRVIALIISGPLCEEAVYRALSLRRAGALLPVVPALALSAALFAAGHGSPIQMAAAFCAGLVFGEVFLRGEAACPGAGLPAAALCHMAANAALLLRG